MRAVSTRAKRIAVSLLGAGSLVFAGLRLRGLADDASPLALLPDADGGAGASETSVEAAPASRPARPRTAAFLAAVATGSPFAASDAPGKARDAQGPASPPLQAILRDGERSLALVGGRLLRVGDRLPIGESGDSAELVAILPGRVRFRRNGTTFEVLLHARASPAEEVPPR